MMFHLSDDASDAVHDGDLPLETVSKCWDKVSKNPKKYWKPGADPDTGEMFPVFFCQHKTFEFAIAVRDDGDRLEVYLAYELGGTGN